MAYRENTQFKSIDAVIEKFFESGALAGVMAYAPIWNEWPSLAGEQFAKSLKPKYVQHGRLHIKVEGHAMLHRVRLQKRAIINNINSRLDGVQLTDIVFET